MTGRPSAFIYGLTDPVTGEVRYIGKANNPEKRLASHMRDSRRRNTPVYCWIRSAGKPGMVVLAECCDDWKAEERRMIAEARARGDRLLNLADGGDEPFCPPAVRAENGRKVSRLRQATPQAKRLCELRRYAGAALKDGLVSEANKEKLRRAASLRPDLFGAFANV